MRATLVVTISLLSALAARSGSAQPAAPASAAQPLQTFDVPTTGKPQTAYILRRVFKPGEHVGLHTHDGIEMAQIVGGTFRVEIRGQADKVYNVGESFFIPRGAAHDATNIGSGEGALAVTYVLDKGAPLRVAVPQ